MKSPIQNIIKKEVMDIRSILQHPASASWVQTTTSNTSTVIWIRIRHTATVSFIGERIHTVYAVKPSVVSPLAIFFCIIFRRRTCTHCTCLLARWQFSFVALQTQDEHIHTVYACITLHACFYSAINDIL